MVKINTAATGHGSKTEIYADGSSIQYNAFAVASKAEKDRMAKLKRAVKILDNLNKRINIQDPCNRYFKSLANRKTFSTLWTDNTIFIDFSPSVVFGFFGATHSNDKDVTISAWCLDTHNRWMVAATLVHELAHVAGAPGGASHAAEKAADKCYFDQQYDRNIMGSIQILSNTLERMA